LLLFEAIKLVAPESLLDLREAILPKFKAAAEGVGFENWRRQLDAFWRDALRR
jgi:hypothetical protein